MEFSARDGNGVERASSDADVVVILSGQNDGFVLKAMQICGIMCATVCWQ